ncbi:MAG: SRPBCC family protein [Pseudomonadota bacterium]
MVESKYFDNSAPGEGWTDRLGLGTELLSYEDMISPEFFDLEREAIFRPAWHYIGRADSIPRPGMYFTKELEMLSASVLATRDDNGDVQVFHNVCPHRGNKLVWDTDARQEVQGRCKTFYCKFHGIQFDTRGQVALLTERDAWLGSQGDDLALATVSFEVWNGFIFVNLDKGGPKETLREFLGDKYYDGLSDYPFELCSERYFVRMNARANWKTMIDGFSETYHAPTTHAKTFNTSPTEHMVYGAEYFGIEGKHRQMVFAGVPDDFFNYEYERLTNAYGTGPRHEFPEVLRSLPDVSNPTGLGNWGNSSHNLWPNFFIQHYHPGWFLTYKMCPLSCNEMRFEIEIFMPKPRNFSEVLSQKSSIYMVLEAALQDFSLLEATQLGLETQAFDRYPLTDQEVLIRAFHRDIYKTVGEYKQKVDQGIIARD